MVRLRLPARANVRRVPGEMNKTERRYSELLAARKAAGEIADWWFEPVKLRLADKCFLTIDFMVQQNDGLLELHDVKARWSNGQVGRDDARIKLKVAAEKYPFRVLAAVYDRRTDWTYEEF